MIFCKSVPLFLFLTNPDQSVGIWSELVGILNVIKNQFSFVFYPIPTGRICRKRSESVGIGRNPWSEMSCALMGGTLFISLASCSPFMSWHSSWEFILLPISVHQPYWCLYRFSNTCKSYGITFCSGAAWIVHLHIDQPKHQQQIYNLVLVSSAVGLNIFSSLHISL